jgi:hypothetical protein
MYAFKSSIGSSMPIHTKNRSSAAEHFPPTHPMHCQHLRTPSVSCTAITSNRSSTSAASIPRNAASHTAQQQLSGPSRGRGAFMRRQQQQQRFPSHHAAPTHVCRVLTESADMALGATAPDFAVCLQIGAVGEGGGVLCPLIWGCGICVCGGGQA